MLCFHRAKLLTVALLGFVIATIPYGIVLERGGPKFTSLSAAGKSGGNGKGGSSNGNSSASQSGGSKSGNNGSGKGHGARNANEGKSDKNGKKTSLTSPTGDKVEISGATIVVRHANGMTEAIKNNFYEMNDARGRKIVRRRASSPDRARLLHMAQ